MLLKLWSLAPRRIQLVIIKAVQRNKRVYRWLMFRHVDLRDRANGTRTHLPPSEMRYRVGGSPHAEEFVAVGKKCAADLESALKKANVELGSFTRILDFGCGCGRTLMHLNNLVPQAQFFGTDIDTEAIKWCQQHINFASFSFSKDRPPMAYAADSFDFIYAISVFTHLNEDYQFCWLEELRRIAKPGGVALLTVNGSQDEQGLVFERTYEEGLFPDWYQNTYHSRDYVFENFGKYFEVLAYFPHSMNNLQDVIVLRKRPD